MFLNKLVFLNESIEFKVQLLLQNTHSVCEFEQPFACFVPELIRIFNKTVN